MACLTDIVEHADTTVDFTLWITSRDGSSTERVPVSNG